MDVRQEQCLGVPRAVRELGLEVGEDVQLGIEGVTSIEVPLVFARIEEGLSALHPLHVLGVHAVAVQDVVLGIPEVVAHRPHHTHVVSRAARRRARRPPSAVYAAEGI